MPPPEDDKVDSNQTIFSENVPSQFHKSIINASSPESIEHSSDISEERTPPSISDNKQSMVKRLLSTRGHLSFDQLSGRLRYFGPTTNCHIYSELNPSDDANQAWVKQQRRAEKVIRSLPAESNDYLLDLFWRNYNSVIHVVHQAAFEKDREDDRTQYYSGFLHICMLAMAYQRFADKSRPDMMRIGLPAKDSTLHKEAKYMLDSELEHPGGILSIQALLLLGDLECGIGRDNLGWLYAGMANRLCFDVGLHLDNQNSGLEKLEIDIGRMTLWACVIYDKYWALFLGRPTSLKSADLAIYNLSAQFERLGDFDPAGAAKKLETQIYEALIDLMELAGKITDIRDPKSSTEADHSAYLRMAALDRELSSWYSKLAKPLQWTPENISMAPFSFFLLHQQYHCTMILLHRPFALYDDANTTTESDSSDSSELDSHLSALSRTVCTKHAVRVARIFWQHRQRFDTRHIFVTGMQHAGTAAIALVAALAYIKNKSSRAANMQYLECLAAALKDMTETYQPAERMSMVLEAVLIELRADSPPEERPRSLVPTRRDSSSHVETSEQYSSQKRRQLAQPRPARKASTIVQLTSTEQQATMEGVQKSLSTAVNMGEHPTSSLDGFVMITPETTDSTDVDGLWPNLNSNEESSLDYPMSSYRDHFSLPRKTSQSTAQPTSPFRSAWMGAQTPQISRPATAFADAGYQSSFGSGSLPARINEEESSNTDMTFTNMLQHTTDWQRPDSDGWPSWRGTQSPKPVDKNRAKTLQSQAETMSGLNDIWDEMMRAGGSGG